jgi:hypothetical protein
VGSAEGRAVVGEEAFHGSAEGVALAVADLQAQGNQTAPGPGGSHDPACPDGTARDVAVLGADREVA